MDLLSHVPIERLDRKHYLLVKERFRERLAKLQASKRKLLYKHIDLDVTMRNLYQFENAWLVGGYLIVYEVGPTWCNDLPLLHEVIVFRLAPGSDFKVVPAFLERKGREAGCAFVVAGTALAPKDAALASLYYRSGFSLSHYHVIKEIT